MPELKSMPELKGETEIANLCSVEHDRDTDEVLITFRVQDKKYKDMVLQVARRKDITLNIRGEKLFAIPSSNRGNDATL